MNEFLTGSKEVNKYVSDTQKEINKLGLLIPPYSDLYENMRVAERLSDEVVSHVIALSIDMDKAYKPPIYLAIQGEPGEGKTTQAIAACTQRGFYVIYVSASELSGSHENDAKDKLQHIYNYAKRLREKNIVAIVIDDFHQGIINNDDNIKKTINTNILTGFMMNIAEQNGEYQIPIILTANSLSNIYEPLLRIGRADIFYWEPNIEEKREIVKSILGKYVKTSRMNDFEHFYYKYRHNNIAFFSQIENQYRKNIIKKMVKECSYFNSDKLNSISQKVCQYKGKITYSEIDKIASDILKDRGIKNNV